MDFGSFTGRVAFVTSGSSGIGRGIVETLIAGGANVGVMARGQDEPDATVAQLSAKGPEVDAHTILEQFRPTSRRSMGCSASLDG